MSTIVRDYDVALQLNSMQQQHLCFYLAAFEGLYQRVIKRYEHQVHLLKQQKKFLHASLEKQNEMVLRRSWVVGMHSGMDVIRTTFLT